MALPNTDPVYSRAGDTQSAQNINSGTILGPTANTAQDGTGTLYPVFQADTTNGGFCQKIAFQSIGTTSLTVCRIYISSITGSWTGNTASNTALFTEVTLPAVTLSQTAQSPHIEVPINFALPAGYRFVLSFGTSTGAAGNGWSPIAIAGKY